MTTNNSKIKKLLRKYLPFSIVAIFFAVFITVFLWKHTARLSDIIQNYSRGETGHSTNKSMAIACMNSSQKENQEKTLLHKIDCASSIGDISKEKLFLSELDKIYELKAETLSSSQKAEYYRIQAWKEKHSGNVNKAIELLHKSLLAQPRLSTYSALMRMLSHSQKYDRIAPLAKKAQALITSYENHPASPWQSVHIKLINYETAVALGHWDAALEKIDAVIDISNSNATFKTFPYWSERQRIRRAIALSHLGRIEEARQILLNTSSKFIRELGVDSSYVNISLYRLYQFLNSQGEEARAKSLWRHFKARLENKGGLELSAYYFNEPLGPFAKVLESSKQEEKRQD